MAWNPDPKVADCREIARKWKYNQIIVLAVNTETGTFQTVSYGETPKLCELARKINEHIHEEVANGIIGIDIYE